MGSLTPIEFRRRTSSTDILENPAERLAYQHTVFCQTCLPYKNPGNIRVWERKQGAVRLRLNAGEIRNPVEDRYIEVGLPYGSRPRLILAHLNREALITGSPRIDVGRSLTGFVKRIQEGRTPTGTQITRFKDQLTRFAASLVRMSVDLPADGHGLPETRAYQVNTHVIDVMELWLEKNEKQRVLWPEVVELSPRYFESLTRHAVPLDERAIGALANSAMALDVYAWLAQRLCRIDRGNPQRVSWKALSDQFGQGFTRFRAFRADFRETLSLVQTQYPGARIEADEKGLLLRNSPPPVLCRHSVVRS